LFKTHLTVSYIFIFIKKKKKIFYLHHYELLKFNIKVNRDRFVLSNGHGCALQYVINHLLGYKISLNDLKNFRQYLSKFVFLFCLNKIII